MFRGETVLSGGQHPGTDLVVCETAAGFYLGFRNPDGSPYSRETAYMTERMARAIYELIRR